MILKNGKRVDGCSDTLPVGTVQPFLGLTPPLGYLVCQGQQISKAEYPELYAICGDAFGASTDTHFYLPDLRGKTIAGFDNTDGTMNTIGKLLGDKTHTHTSAAHTHTVAAHGHTVNNSTAYNSGGPSNNTSGGPSNNTSGSTTLTAAQSGVGNHTHTIYDGSRADQISFAGFYAATGTTMRYRPANNGVTDNLDACLKNTYTSANATQGHTHTLSSHTHSLQSHTHSIGAHNHTATTTALTTDSTTPNATGSNTNFQPTMVLNWIVKAVMLIPDYFVVENTLTSSSTSNALSAAQGKILSDKVNNCLSRSGGTVSGNLISYYHDFLISANEFNFTSGSYNNGSIYFNYRAGTNDADTTAGPITNYYFYNGQREMATNVYAKYFQSSNGTLLGTNNFYVITGTTSAPDSGGNAELMNVPSDVYVISIKPTNNINATIVPYYPGNGYEHWYIHVLKSYGTAVTSVSYAALVYKPS